MPPPSFDCARATRVAEKRVCAVRALAGPDRAVAELGPMSTPRRDWPGSIGMPTTVRVFVIWVSRLAHPLGHDERSEACSDPRAS